ncbi:MAG: GNAT family N-acetyltransferase [Simkania sp.]|nr:GNAT family N-acetyltransferase [Simkania sp.]
MKHLPDGYDIRYTVDEDLKALRDWLLQPGMLHWFPMNSGTELEAALLGWIGFCRFQASLTASVEEEPCAIGTLYLMPYKKVAHECLVKLIVAPKWQRCGIGSSVMRNLMHLAKKRFGIEICYLEIVEGNPLEAILQTLGFTLVAKQDMYFKEDGRYFARLVYECILSEQPFLRGQ